jgi:4-methyl-5(b-hydroxyethyl)-thiazole monophosphate biosynthesis
LAKALVLIAPGFEEIEASTIVDILRRCHVEVTVAGLKPDVIEGSHAIRFTVDKSIDEVSVKDFDAVICPGGAPGYENLRKDQRVLTMIKEAFNSNKLVAAICAAPAVLSDAGVLKGKACTIYPGMEEELKKGGGKPEKGLVVVDKNIVTSMGPATALPFALKLAEKLVGKEAARKVWEETLANLALKKRG